MKTSLIILSASILSVLTISCEKENEPAKENPGYSRGIYVVNEGAYNNNNGSISFVNDAGTIIINDIFYAANGRALGDIIQSLSIVNDSLGIIVVNHSERLEIVRLTTFQTVRDPLAVNYPRYFLQVSEDKGYVSSGSLNGKIFIIDLSSFQISDSIEVGYGPEVMLLVDDRVFVANSGGWSSDSTLSVIDVASGVVTDTIFVAHVPVDMSLDDEDNLWLYCKGFTDYADTETDSYIMKVSTTTHEVQWQAKVGKANDYNAAPARCAISADGSRFYYIRPDGIYSINTADPAIPDQPLVAGSFYGVEVHPVNGRIYAFETLSFSGNGMMKIFETDGTLYAQGMVGVGPNGAVFNLQ